MQQGALFDSGILGTSFHWWIGQIADDSVWRDNVICTPFANEGENIGWGKRYKVRILGLHDQGETEMPSNDLPWAQVMLPVTAGGGLANRGQTPSLHQGNIVFGFFLDGQAMTTPIIMGVVGNNSQNILAPTIGDNRVTNDQPGSLAVSGYATGQRPKNILNGEQETAPDSGLKSEHPNINSESITPPGVTLNKFGLRPDLPLTSEQLADAQAARAKLDVRTDLSFIEKEELVMKSVAEGIKKRKAESTKPNSLIESPVQKENLDVQQITAADVKGQVYGDEMVPMPIPDDPVDSAMKSIQIIIDNITQKIDHYLNAIQNYTDAISNPTENLNDMICKGSEQIAKYMKVLFDQMMEFVLKQLNVAMSAIVGLLPSNLRNNFGDIKEEINKQLVKLYNDITADIADQICQALIDSLQPEKREEEARFLAENKPGKNEENGEAFKTTPKVSPCYAESISSTVISKNKKKIDDANKNIMTSVNGYIDSISKDLVAVGGVLSEGTSVITDALGDLSGGFDTATEFISSDLSSSLDVLPDIGGGLGSALKYKSIIMNVFGELEPKKAINDFYQLAVGGSGLGSSNLPSIESLSKSVATSSQERKDQMSDAEPKSDFITPSTDQSDIDLRKNTKG